MYSLKIIDYELGNLFGTDWVKLRSFDTSCQGRIMFRNNSDKTIRFVHFEAFLVDKMNYVVNDSWNIHKLTEFRGPLEPGEVGCAYTRAIMGQNHLVDTVAIEYAEIEYMDGTRERMG